MAKGYPDYFGQSIWPKYGTMISDLDSDVTIVAGTWNTIFEIAGPGVLFWLRFKLSHATIMTSSELNLTIDGETADYARVDALDPYGSVLGFRSILQFPYYHANGRYFVATLGMEVPFHDAAILKMSNGSGGNYTGGIAMYSYFKVT